MRKAGTYSGCLSRETVLFIFYTRKTKIAYKMKKNVTNPWFDILIPVSTGFVVASINGKYRISFENNTSECDKSKKIIQLAELT